MVASTPQALLQQTAYELARWKSTDPVDELANAQTLIDTLVAGVANDTVVEHPLTLWVADHFNVHWKLAGTAVAAAGVGGGAPPASDHWLLDYSTQTNGTLASAVLDSEGNAASDTLFDPALAPEYEVNNGWLATDGSGNGDTNFGTRRFAYAAPTPMPTTYDFIAVANGEGFVNTTRSPGLLICGAETNGYDGYWVIWPFDGPNQWREVLVRKTNSVGNNVNPNYQSTVGFAPTVDESDYRIRIRVTPTDLTFFVKDITLDTAEVELGTWTDSRSRGNYFGMRHTAADNDWGPNATKNDCFREMRITEA